ncbi:MAG: hypothetical protein ABNH38_01030 [Tateyamaria sp.]|uniref:hypothetical protein n=1 Tax=Tateyamaria sp. TaxID=1929288 RepID=UPI0032DE18A7
MALSCQLCLTLTQIAAWGHANSPNRRDAASADARNRLSLARFAWPRTRLLCLSPTPL